MSNQIFELFGYKFDDASKEAQNHRENCLCPFTGSDCDGGGNRYQTFLDMDLVSSEGLKKYFTTKRKNIPPGICSLQIKSSKWIVCPRRVFSIGNLSSSIYHRTNIRKIVEKYCTLIKNKKIGIWSEVKIKYSDNDIDTEAPEKTFDYTFDYLVASVGRKGLKEISKDTAISETNLRKQLAEMGYTLSMQSGDYFMEEYPIGPLNIIEIMTSSTSGGNKQKGTTIQQSFIKAIKGEPHEAPGINYRQVWARMVSQLIVKSQIGQSWHGKTIWVLQDSLTDYISKSTDLNLSKLVSKLSKEINILSLCFTDEKDDINCLKLSVDKLFAGEIPPIQSDTDFHKLLHASSIPDMESVKNKIIQRPFRGIL